MGEREAIHACRRAVRAAECNRHVHSVVLGVDIPPGAVVAAARLAACSQAVNRGYHPILGVEADPGRVRALDHEGDERRDAYKLETDDYGDSSEMRWVWRLSDVRAVEPSVSTRDL